MFLIGFYLAVISIVFLLFWNQYRAALIVVCHLGTFSSGYTIAQKDYEIPAQEGTKLENFKKDIADLRTFKQGAPFTEVLKVKLEFANGDVIVNNVQGKNLIYYVKGSK